MLWNFPTSDESHLICILHVGAKTHRNKQNSDILTGKLEYMDYLSERSFFFFPNWHCLNSNHLYLSLLFI